MTHQHDVAAIASKLTTRERDDLSRAMLTAGRWWVPCPSTRMPLIQPNGDMSPLGIAVRDHLTAGASHER